jgi:hypothetical protein
VHDWCFQDGYGYKIGGRVAVFGVGMGLFATFLTSVKICPYTGIRVVKLGGRGKYLLNGSMFSNR